ncbi:hypothetical protein KIMH_07280 [Bombiscardovia apis]|uniref:[Ribosomal protein bS18]-alanine N-acetyltransferase n=1 Tax=Bombiscardovia apis TaxID=2932182 RepID=A0ABN6SHC9_9BIFI|nr:ribosomal protein S18-alanine N-acetyltransferase [Bombiscardovia apis]BDR54617.1 hypothetical protein KIMH_07280 [Bombiscardovia apis]
MLREVELADVDALADLEREVFAADAWTPGMLRQELQAPARTYLADEFQGQIRAYAGFWYDGEDAELMTIGVLEQYRQQALGSTLLTALIARAKNQGARRMLLEVRVDNEPAIAMYTRFGFERLGLRKRYYQPEGIDAYTMALQLSD